MIHAAAPRTHRRRQGDAEFSRSSKRLRRHHTRHSLFTKPQSVEAVADSPVTANLVPRHFRISQPMEDREVPRGTCLFTLLWTLSFRGSGCVLNQRQGAA